MPVATEREAWITGIGLVTALGEGLDAHWAALNGGKDDWLKLDAATYAPYQVHPAVAFDVVKQIPDRGDRRQMEAWQRLGTYAAGLALDDAGVKGQDELLKRMHMIVAAGGGERATMPSTDRSCRASSDQHARAVPQRAADERPEADAVPGPAVEPPRGQHFHRPRRGRFLAHLHGRGNGRRRRGPRGARPLPCGAGRPVPGRRGLFRPSVPT